MCYHISAILRLWSVFTHLARSVQICLNKRKHLHKKRVQLLQDWFYLWTIHSMLSLCSWLSLFVINVTLSKDFSKSLKLNQFLYTKVDHARFRTFRDVI